MLDWRAEPLPTRAFPSVTIALIVTGDADHLKNPDCPRKGKPFVPKRAGAQYSTGLAVLPPIASTTRRCRARHGGTAKSHASRLRPAAR